jgi:hypothetical protein
MKILPFHQNRPLELLQTLAVQEIITGIRLHRHPLEEAETAASHETTKILLFHRNSPLEPLLPLAIQRTTTTGIRLHHPLEEDRKNSVKRDTAAHETTKILPSHQNCPLETLQPLAVNSKIQMEVTTSHIGSMTGRERVTNLEKVPVT